MVPDGSQGGRLTGQVASVSGGSPGRLAGRVAIVTGWTSAGWRTGWPS
jgi:hypothetical protein